MARFLYLGIMYSDILLLKQTQTALRRREKPEQQIFILLP